jgi:hypothetical protein
MEVLLSAVLSSKVRHLCLLHLKNGKESPGIRHLFTKDVIAVILPLASSNALKTGEGSVSTKKGVESTWVWIIRHNHVLCDLGSLIVLCLRIEYIILISNLRPIIC